MKRNGNKRYVNKNGKSVEPKIFKHDYICPCAVNKKNPQKCTERVTSEDQQHCFNQFWDLHSHNAQNSYIAGAVIQTAVQRRFSKSYQRNFRRQYFLHDTTVCRETFVKSLGISTKRVNTALSKKRSGSLLDRRGGQRESRKLPAEVLQKVINHIESFPRYKSHYTRSVSTKEFLNPELSLSKMYDLYSVNIQKRVLYQLQSSF